MKDLKEVVAANIAALRTERGMTQSRLAELLNYSDKAVSKWERAESIPDVFVLKAIADTFGVTVDYLLAEEHGTADAAVKRENTALHRNRTIISCLAVSLVWLIATFLFVTFSISLPDSDFVASGWLLYVYCVPPSAVLLLIFNSIWGFRIRNFVYLSTLVWSTLAAVYLSLLCLAGQNLWMVFIIGVPAQVIIILWSGLRSHKK